MGNFELWAYMKAFHDFTNISKTNIHSLTEDPLDNDEFTKDHYYTFPKAIDRILFSIKKDIILK